MLPSWTRMASVFGGHAPRRTPGSPEVLGPFRALDRGEDVLRVHATGDGSLWALSQRSVTDLGRERTHRLPEGCSGSLHSLGGRDFLVVAGSAGVFVLGPDGLGPLHPFEPATALGWGRRGVLVAGIDGAGEVRLRRGRSVEEPWHSVAVLPEKILGIADLETEIWLLGGEHWFRLSPGGRLRAQGSLPGAQPLPESLFVADGVAYLADAEGGLWMVPPGEGTPQALPLEEDSSWVGQGPRGPVCLGSDGLLTWSGGSWAPVEGLPALPRQDLEVCLADPAQSTLAFHPKGVLAPGRIRWKTVLEAQVLPRSATWMKRTPAGAVWIRDEGGRLFFRPSSQRVLWVKPQPELAPDWRPLGLDGEGLLLCPSARSERVDWVPAPRAPRQKDTVEVASEVRLLDLPGPPTAATSLGGKLWIGGEGWILAPDADGPWGVEQGVPNLEVLAMESLFEDLWVIFSGMGGPHRFLGGAPHPELPLENGPSGLARGLAADNVSGQVWVSFKDGRKGGVASMSREGIWITQLRLPSWVRDLGAEAGHVAAVTGQGVFYLAPGSRKRRTFSVSEGLAGPEGRAIALSEGQILVDAGRVLSLSEVGFLAGEAPPEPLPVGAFDV